LQEGPALAEMLVELVVPAAREAENAHDEQDDDAGL
jgi:hypothetical protein